MQSPEWVVDTSLEFADAMLKAERRNRMTSPDKLESFQQIKEIKEAIAKYHASLRNIGVHRPHAANALIHEIQEILQFNWSQRLSCS